MAGIRELICLVVLGCLLVHCDNIPEEEDYVFVLTSKTFDNFVDNNDFTVVFFHAPWCGHCVSMKPNYHEAGKNLRENELFKTAQPVVLAKVDATKETDIATRFRLQGYPTVKIFRKYQGKIVSYEYEGPREDGTAIAEYLAKEANNKDWKPAESKVTVLSLTNFTQWIERNPVSLVEFYAPGCGFCVQLEPKYEKAAGLLSIQADPIPLAKVDATKEPELSMKYNITGYPTLYVFRNNPIRYYEYRGGRETFEIVEYMKKLSNSGSKQVKTFNAFNSNVKKLDQRYILGLFKSPADLMYQAFTDFASKYADDFDLAHTFNADEFLKYFKSSKIKVPSILVYYHDLVITKNEPKYHVLNDENAQIKDIEEFIFKNSLPLVGHINSRNKMLIYDKKPPVCYVFYDIDIELRKHLVYLRDKVAKIANKFKHITFALVNQTASYELMQSVQLEDTESENSMVCMNEKGKLFIHDQESDESFDTKEILEFVKKFDQGKLEPYVKSEPIPSSKNKKKVQVLVGKTIDQAIRATDKEIFLGLVGHDRFIKSDEFEGNLEKLASEYSSKKNVMFAKINVFKNDLPDILQPVNMNEPSFLYVSSRNGFKPEILKGEDWTSLSKLKKLVNQKMNISQEHQEL